MRAYERERNYASNKIPVKTLDLQGGSGGVFFVVVVWLFFWFKDQIPNSVSNTKPFTKGHKIREEIYSFALSILT